MKRLSHFGIILGLIMSMIGFVIPAIPVAAGVNQCSWVGGGADNNWSTVANWGCSVGTVPTTGYDLIFPYLGTAETPVNDLLATNTYTSIWFSGTTPVACTSETPYSISGNDIKISGDINDLLVNGCYRTLLMSNNITMTANSIISLDASTDSSLYIQGAVTNSTFTLDINNSSTLGGLSVSSTVTGSGDITTTGDVNLTALTNSFTGNISATNGSLSVVSPNTGSLGDLVGTTTIGNAASLYVEVCVSGGTVSENITFTGAPDSTFNAKLVTTISCGGGGPYTEYYNSIYIDKVLTLDGVLTFNSSSVIASGAQVVMSGTVNGAGNTLTTDPAFGNSLVISAATNTTATPNGTYINPMTQTTLADSQPANTVMVGARNEVTITGTRSDVSVAYGGVLMGNGTVGALGVSTGTIRPGLSPGILNTGNLVLTALSVSDFELQGTTPGAGGHDQLNVTGTVDLGSSTMNVILFGGYVPVNIGDSYTIINNDGADAVTGTFAGLAEGASINNGAYRFTISYVGGDGNDVVLTTAYIPGPPGTGFGVFQRNIQLPYMIIGFGMMVVTLSAFKIKKLKAKAVKA